MNSREAPIAVRPANRFCSRASLAGAGAFAAAATVAVPSLAQAQIIRSGMLDEDVNSGNRKALLDLNGNSTRDPDEANSTFVPETKVEAFVAIESITPSKVAPGIAFGTTKPSAPAGATTDSNLSFLSGLGTDTTSNTVDPTYLGLRYQAAGGPFCGRVEVSFAPDRSFGALHQWAYNSTSGVANTFGAIPEPFAMALVGIAAVAFTCLRKHFRRA